VNYSTGNHRAADSINITLLFTSHNAVKITAKAAYLRYMTQYSKALLSIGCEPYTGSLYHEHFCAVFLDTSLPLSKCLLFSTLSFLHKAGLLIGSFYSLPNSLCSWYSVFA